MSPERADRYLCRYRATFPETGSLAVGGEKGLARDGRAIKLLVATSRQLINQPSGLPRAACGGLFCAGSGKGRPPAAPIRLGGRPG